MYARIIVAPLLLAIWACAPHPVAQTLQSTPPPAVRSSALSTAALESSDPKPGRLCRVGTKDCMTPSEMSVGLCMLSTGRCKADGHLQYASSMGPLQLEPPVTGGANREITLPVER